MLNVRRVRSDVVDQRPPEDNHVLKDLPQVDTMSPVETPGRVYLLQLAGSYHFMFQLEFMLSTRKKSQSLCRTACPG